MSSIICTIEDDEDIEVEGTDSEDEVTFKIEIIFSKTSWVTSGDVIECV